MSSRNTNTMSNTTTNPNVAVGVDSFLATTDTKAPEGIYNRTLIAETMNGFAETGKTVWVMFYLGNSACHGLVRGYAGHSDAFSYRVRGGDFSEIQFKVSDIHCIHNNTITLH